MEYAPAIQGSPEEKWTSLMRLGITDLPFSQSIEYLGMLIDLSLDLKRDTGLDHALRWAESLSERELTSQQRALLHYFRSNIWANIAHLEGAIHEEAGEDENAVGTEGRRWERKETERQIVHLRAALMESGFRELSKTRQCQILTNLASLYNEVGRFVEAVEYWRRAISIVPSFSMALGNMAIGLADYAYSLYDPGHRSVFLREALSHLESALASQLHPAARRSFDAMRTQILAQLAPDLQNQELDMIAYCLGDSRKEIEYRQWCLMNGLFLNPLNDLGAYPIAARDVFTAPSIVCRSRGAPRYHGFFNQLKQEFVSARYFYYEGTKAISVHFSDKDVLLYNTLDYPLYSLASETVKAAFRMCYSLFDKIAYFLNAYMTLGIPERRVYFRTIWYRNQRRRKGVKPQFEQRQNSPLRGLFWLSKDLFENQEGFRDSTEPDARDLAKIRNHLEHKYLKLHSESLKGLGKRSADDEAASESSSMFLDDLAFSLYHRDFEAKTLRLLKMVRAALIYLSLSIHREEYVRQQEEDSEEMIFRQRLGVWKDEWKI